MVNAWGRGKQHPQRSGRSVLPCYLKAPVMPGQQTNKPFPRIPRCTRRQQQCSAVLSSAQRCNGARESRPAPNTPRERAISHQVSISCRLLGHLTASPAPQLSLDHQVPVFDGDPNRRTDVTPTPPTKQSPISDIVLQVCRRKPHNVLQAAHHGHLPPFQDKGN